MKFSANYWMFKNGIEGRRPIRDVMREAKDLGFDAVELCIGDTGMLTDKTSKAECEDLASFAETIGIEIASVISNQTWIWSPSSSDANTRTRIIGFTEKALQVTKWLRTNVYLFEPGNVDIPSSLSDNREVIAYDVCYERSLEAVMRLIPTAEELLVSIAIENVGNKFLLSPLEMRSFIDSFNSKFICAYFDIGNVVLTGYPQHWIQILGKRIKRVHVKDFKREIRTGESFVDLLEGDVDFLAVRQALIDVGYDSYLTAEVLPYSQGRLERTLQRMRVALG